MLTRRGLKSSLVAPGTTPTPAAAVTTVTYAYTPLDWPNRTGVPPAFANGMSGTYVAANARLYGFPPSAKATPYAGVQLLIPK